MCVALFQKETCTSIHVPHCTLVWVPFMLSVTTFFITSNKMQKAKVLNNKINVSSDFIITIYHNAILIMMSPHMIDIETHVISLFIVCKYYMLY